MINIGIVGTGFMAATHIKAYRQVPEARIFALCNPSGRNLDGDFSKVAGNVGSTDPVKLDMASVKAYRDFDAFLADPEIEVVDICTHTITHPQLAIAALKAGKHVLCEKPMARTSALAREMAAAAIGAKGFLMPAMCLRFWPEWSWLKEAVASNRYGRALSARFRRVAQPPAWGQNYFFKGEDSGGALFDLHIHDADFAQYCFGRPRAVYAGGYSSFSGAVDHVVAQYQMESGVVVSAEGSWAMTEGFGFNMSYTVNFEQATADYDIGRGADALKLFEKGREPQVIKCEGPDGYTREIAHFLECVRTNRPPSVVTAADGVSSVEICEAELHSIRTRQLVQFKTS